MLLIKHAIWLIGIINNLYNDRFTGNIQINFFEGGVTNVTKTESFKPVA